MAKWSSISMLDGGLDVLGTANEMYLCTAQPTDRANAITLSLALQAMDPGDFVNTGAAGAARLCTVAAKVGVTVTANGDANHIALCTGAELLYVTTCPVMTLETPGTTSVSSWVAQLEQPT